jgi:CcmD family protein
MNTFVAAYVVVWLAVLAYVARLGSRQRQLQLTLDAIQQQLDQTETSEAVGDFHSKAA